MKLLIVEDDFTSRKVLQKFLSPYGECDIAVDGKEAIEAFLRAWYDGEPYDLICLDIMMPNMDGQEVLRNIRSLEKEQGKEGFKGTKVIMTTAIDTFDTIMESFRDQCEAYLIKPIDRAKLVGELKKLNLIKDT